MKRRVKWGLMENLWPVARIAIRNSYGMSLQKFAALVLSSGDTVIDVGANAGDISKFLSLCVGRAGTVHSFEPNPVLHANLIRLAKERRYSNVIPHHLAASNADGELEFLVDNRPSAQASTLNKEHAAREAELHGATYTSMKVRAVTLDVFCSNRNLHPQFIKIDVEGAEEDVITGAQKTILTYKPMLWFECWCGKKEGVSINNKLGHLRWLEANGFSLFLGSTIKFLGKWINRWDEENPAVMLPVSASDLETLPPSGLDILAVPESEVHKIRMRGLVGDQLARVHLVTFVNRAKSDLLSTGACFAGQRAFRPL